ncbi:unnamed protein product [Blepharisma stoltei]|uniref:Uncharacterized protein n=1 Tax=Blepharisma stoltei TaxID=1481888 RepID=A0AAU9KB52_9CILI|nr:unnamed protein product [Blepharisma stoltei]
MESEEEFQKKAKQLFYKTSAQQVGLRAVEIGERSKNGIDGKFTRHLLDSGMWRNNGLYTRVENDRYIDGSKDWMDKIN